MRNGEAGAVLEVLADRALDQCISLSIDLQTTSSHATVSPLGQAEASLPTCIKYAMLHTNAMLCRREVTSDPSTGTGVGVQQGVYKHAHRGGGLVGDQHAGPAQQGTRHAQQLPLAQGPVVAALRHARLQPVVRVLHHVLHHPCFVALLTIIS